jgi:hypothetical protein
LAAQVGTDDLKPKKGADDGAGHGGRNCDLLPSLLIKLGIVQRDPDTADVDHRQDAGGGRRGVGGREAGAVAGGESVSKQGRAQKSLLVMMDELGRTS